MTNVTRHSQNKRGARERLQGEWSVALSSQHLMRIVLPHALSIFASIEMSFACFVEAEASCWQVLCSAQLSSSLSSAQLSSWSNNTFLV
eukprot:9036-Heterococcus_DN1.PRE.2